MAVVRVAYVSDRQEEVLEEDEVKSLLFVTRGGENQRKEGRRYTRRNGGRTVEYKQKNSLDTHTRFGSMIWKKKNNDVSALLLVLRVLRVSIRSTSHTLPSVKKDSLVTFSFLFFSDFEKSNTT